MRAVKKWRYYCDFCSRAKMVKKATEKHERGCTLNPNRVCGLCARVNAEQKPIADLMAPLEDGNFDALKRLAEDCPACILAALRQYNKPRPSDEQFWNEWDFKAALAEFWNCENNRREEERYYG